MAVSTKAKSKAAASPVPTHTPHTSRKIAEMIIVMVVVLLLVSVGLFITQVYGGRSSTIVNNYYYGGTPADQMAAPHAFQQVTAPAGQAVAGYPKSLVPAHGQVTASYHNQYNGYDQYTLVVSANVPLAAEYAAFQQFVTAQKFKVTSKTATTAEDTINAQQGMDYVTVQLVPQGQGSTIVTINYGTPIK